MMRQYELVERVTRYNPNADENLLNKAYVYAMQKHGTQQRANGDPYFSHPLEVAGILTDLKLDDATIAVALLHDTIEDTDATRAEIDQMFGEDIGRLVEGLTKIGKLDLVSKKAAQAENLRKLLLAISSDIRVLLVKLADRLHNMRTLQHMPEEARGRIAEETLEIYAPLAGRMGMHDMREELEDLAFRTVNPEAYATIERRLSELRSRNRSLIEAIERELTERLERAGIKAEVKGREKQPYSIFRKMERKAVSFEQLSDILGFRVVVGSVAECYAAVGVVHTTWPAVPGRFKDYVSTPKQNDYRSIHTTVVGPGSQRVELQVRTADMERIAEYGIAAHALYKDGVTPPPPKHKGNGAANGKLNGANGNGASTLRGFNEEIRAYEWLRRTVEMLAEGDTPEEFLEHTKLELFQDQVFCFTPKGRLIALPRGATPIDFAYSVHTDIGDTTVGSRINGRNMPLMTELHNGDEVEILCSKAQVPPAAWESMVVTGKARSAIRRATRAAVRKQYAGLGRQIVERAFARAGREYSDKVVEAVLPRLAQSNVEDMLAAVGRGEIPSINVLKAVHPDHKEERLPRAKSASEEGWFGLKRGSGMKFRVPGLSRKPAAEARSGSDRAIPIRGIHGEMAVRFAKGGAIPGERIVGIMTPGEGITIYPIQSPALKDFDDEPERWLDVRWDVDDDHRSRFPVRIEVTAINEPGTLAQVSQVMADNDANITNIRIVKSAPDFSVMLFDMDVFDVKHLNRLVAQLRARPVVSGVTRVNG
jgi:GTP diphosphokinase / guanosine-3',5'-bis(diphosphate) 3'-diphosphatase